MSELYLHRYPSTASETHGLLLYGDETVCFTLEDVDRGLDSSMSVKEIRSIKIYGQTAIPYGRYELKWYDSPKFGRVPQLLNVPGFSYILIHSGNFPHQTSGCVLPGLVKDEGKVLKSREAFQKLTRLIRDQDIKFINIVKTS